MVGRRRWREILQKEGMHDINKSVQELRWGFAELQHSVGALEAEAGEAKE